MQIFLRSVAARGGGGKRLGRKGGIQGRRDSKQGKLFGFPTTTRYRLTKWFQMGREKGRNRKLCRELEERKMRDKTEKERKNRRENYGYDIKIHKKGLKDPCTRKLCYRPP